MRQAGSAGDVGGDDFRHLLDVDAELLEAGEDLLVLEHVAREQAERRVMLQLGESCGLA